MVFTAAWAIITYRSANLCRAQSCRSVARYTPCSIYTRANVAQGSEKSGNALVRWRDGTTPAFRASLLIKWSQLVQQHKHDIATIMTLVSRKTLLKTTQRFVDLTRTPVHDKYTYDWPRTLYTSISPQAFLYGLNSPQEVPHGAVGIHIQATSLELGGNVLFLVFEDANLDQAVAAPLVSKFRGRYMLVPIIFSSTRPCMRNSFKDLPPPLPPNVSWAVVWMQM